VIVLRQVIFETLREPVQDWQIDSLLRGGLAALRCRPTGVVHRIFTYYLSAALALEIARVVPLPQHPWQGRYPPLL